MSFIPEGLLPGRLFIMNHLAWEKRRVDSVPGGHTSWLTKQCKNPGKGKAVLVPSDLCSGSVPLSIALLPGLCSELTRLEVSLSVLFCFGWNTK